jgi:hypothetical protein
MQQSASNRAMGTLGVPLLAAVAVVVSTAASAQFTYDRNSKAC